MFDRLLRQHIHGPLELAGEILAARRVSADQLSVAGLIVGLGAALAIIHGAFFAAAALILLNRLLDGLDGPVARARSPSATSGSVRGGFVDITFDFIVYAAIPLAFATHDPARNALAAAAVLAGIVVNSAAFFAFALAAQSSGMTTGAQGAKAFYYVAGLAEGFETIVAMVAMCLWPGAFPTIALAFAALCLLSGAARIGAGWLAFTPTPPQQPHQCPDQSSPE